MTEEADEGSLQRLRDAADDERDALLAVARVELLPPVSEQDYWLPSTTKLEVLDVDRRRT